jgi:hypothetical protein
MAGNFTPLYFGHHFRLLPLAFSFVGTDAQLCNPIGDFLAGYSGKKFIARHPKHFGQSKKESLFGML